MHISLLQALQGLWIGVPIPQFLVWLLGADTQYLQNRVPICDALRLFMLAAVTSLSLSCCQIHSGPSSSVFMVMSTLILGVSAWANRVLSYILFFVCPVILCLIAFVHFLFSCFVSELRASLTFGFPPRTGKHTLSGPWGCSGDQINWQQVQWQCCGEHLCKKLYVAERCFMGVLRGCHGNCIIKMLLCKTRQREGDGWDQEKVSCLINRVFAL